MKARNNENAQRKNRPVRVNTLGTVKRLQAEARRQSNIVHKLEVANRLYHRLNRNLWIMKSVDPDEILDILRNTGENSCSEAVVRLILDDDSLSSAAVADFAHVIEVVCGFCVYMSAFVFFVEGAGGIEAVCRDMKKPLLKGPFSRNF